MNLFIFQNPYKCKKEIYVFEKKKASSEYGYVYVKQT